jgi:anaerobic selenocysteine-containing dehydrogenase
VATRRGKQFNSMVFGAYDPVTGADRDDVFIDAADARELGLVEGDRVTLRSDTGAYTGRLRFARLARRSLQVHWPEGNVLIAAGPEHREPASRVPDYNAVVTVTPADT